MKRRHEGKRVILGVTGSFGSGKSTVASMFKRLGATVVDADKIAHKTLAPGSKVHEKIAACFGRGILRKDGTIDRAALAAIVFNNRRLLKRLNAIVHKEVIRVINEKVDSFNQGVMVLDVPLLIEAGLNSLADKIIVVRSKRKIQVARLLSRTHLTREAVFKRMGAQMPLSLKIRFGDFIIDNSGTRYHTEAQVRKIWKKVVLN
jgi:dephospho-CoA kinase